MFIIIITYIVSMLQCELPPGSKTAITMELK